VKILNRAALNWLCVKYIVAKLFRVTEPRAVWICYAISDMFGLVGYVVDKFTYYIFSVAVVLLILPAVSYAKFFGIINAAYYSMFFLVQVLLGKDRKRLPEGTQDTHKTTLLSHSLNRDIAL